MKLLLNHETEHELYWGRASRWMPHWLRLLKIYVTFGLALTLTGCTEQEPVVKEPVRAIKAFEVSERPSGSKRDFAGTVQAVDSSELSFEVAGNVATLAVDVGDRVAEGDNLAALDRTRLQLAVDAAQANSARAKAINYEKQQNFKRQTKLFEKKIISELGLQKAEAEAKSAQNNLDYVRWQLDLALRDLDKAVLRAPFDGTIATRHVDPFKEVARGQPIYTIYDPQAMELKISVPESSVKALQIGLPAVIKILGVTADPFEGIVSEIGTSAEVGNTYPVKIKIADEEGIALPGMTAAANLTLKFHDVSGAFLIPAMSIIPGETEGEGFVFRLDKATSTVKRVRISGGIGVRGDMAVITEGLSTGDIIAAAGVTFLQDGQKVKIWEP